MPKFVLTILDNEPPALTTPDEVVWGKVPALTASMTSLGYGMPNDATSPCQLLLP